jgi:hypothetical protein
VGNTAERYLQEGGRWNKKIDVSSAVMIWLKNAPPLSALSIKSLQLHMLLSVWSCVRTVLVNMRHVRSSDRILWEVPEPISAPAAATSTLLLPYGKRLCNLNSAMGQGFFTKLMLDLTCFPTSNFPVAQTI